MSRDCREVLASLLWHARGEIAPRQVASWPAAVWGGGASSPRCARCDRSGSTPVDRRLQAVCSQLGGCLLTDPGLSSPGDATMRGSFYQDRKKFPSIIRENTGLFWKGFSESVDAAMCVGVERVQLARK